MFLRHNLIGILWALFILVACVMPHPDIPNTPLLSSDKLFHALVFGFLTFQLSIGLTKQTVYCRLKYRAWKVAFIFGVAYGAVIELIQGLLLPYRTMDIMDIVANTVGALVGVGLFYLVFLYTKKKKNVYMNFSDK